MKLRKATYTTAGVLALSIFAASCNPSADKEKEMEDSEVAEVEVAEDHSDANMSSTGMRERTDFDEKVEEYTAKYPELEYTYIETKEGKLATAKGNYQLKVEGINNEDDLDEFIKYVEENYSRNRQKMNSNVEVAAKPQGGFDEYYEALKENTDYPKEALRADVGGTVFVEFIVTEDGKVDQVKAMEGMYYTKERAYMDELDEAAVSAIKNTKWDWVPAKQGGKPVSMRMEIPITFDPEV